MSKKELRPQPLALDRDDTTIIAVIRLYAGFMRRAGRVPGDRRLISIIELADAIAEERAP